MGPERKNTIPILANVTDVQRHRVVAAPQIRAHGAATDDARLFGRASKGF